MKLALLIPLAVCVLAISNLGRFLLTGKWLYPLPVSAGLVLVAFLGLMLGGCDSADYPGKPDPACRGLYEGKPIRLVGTDQVGVIYYTNEYHGTAWAYLQGVDASGSIRIRCADIQGQSPAGVE